MKSLITIWVIFFFPTTLNASEFSLLMLDLNSTNITYNYTSGHSYNVKFEEQGVTYRYLKGSKPEKLWGLFLIKLSN